jgi:RNA polymerase sigma-70 factor (ECF subfamily)
VQELAAWTFYFQERRRQENMSEQMGSGIPDHDNGSAPPQSDEQLMLRYARGETVAFTTLFHRYRQPVFGFFRRRVSDYALAEELTQETFIAILRGAGEYQPTALFRTYLYAIGYRILRTHRRKAYFRAGFLAKTMPGQEPCANPSLELDLLMREAIRKLERIDREVLLLREFEQLSYAEIAAILDLPMNTVRSRLFRARTALRELLSRRPARVAGAQLSITKEQA